MSFSVGEMRPDAPEPDETLLGFNVSQSVSPHCGGHGKHHLGTFTQCQSSLCGEHMSRLFHNYRGKKKKKNRHDKDKEDKMTTGRKTKTT